MAYIQIWHTLIKDGGKIESHSCSETEIKEELDNFIQEYGRINSIVCEDGDVGKWRFHLFTDDYNDDGSSYFMILTVSEAQFKKLYPYIIVLQRKESVEKLLERFRECDYGNGIRECEKVLSYFDSEQTTLSSH